MVLVEKPEAKRRIGRSKRRYANNIKVDLIEILLKGADWIDWAQARNKYRTAVKAVMIFRVPQNAG
jgi:hypothetical protein